MEWKHWTQVNRETEWRWPHFSPRELACKGTGQLKIDPASLDKLEALRNRLGVPMLITSAYRSPQHNADVGGAKRSQHMLGKAFDVRMDNHDPDEFEAAAKALGFNGIGHYPRHGFMHIDTREAPARWHSGGWFDAGETHLPPEPEPKRKTEAARDGAISAGAVIAGGEIVQAALNEIGSYLPEHIARWVFGAAVVVGAGVALWRIFGARSAEVEVEV